MTDEIADIFNLAMKVCKVKDYERLQMSINASYNELIIADTKSRRIKASTLISVANKLDIHIEAIKREYGLFKEKFALTEIPAIEQYIKQCLIYRNLLLKQKKHIGK